MMSKLQDEKLKSVSGGQIATMDTDLVGYACGSCGKVDTDEDVGAERPCPHCGKTQQRLNRKSIKAMM